MTSFDCRARAVLCDVDGVLRHWPPAGDIEAAYSLPAGTLAAAAFAAARLNPAITGQVSDEQWRSQIVADLTRLGSSRVTARAVVTAWSNLIPEVDAEVVAVLKDVRHVARLALVSNATTRLEWDLKRQGLHGLADVVVNSARIGLAKPDPRVYGVAAERAGVPVDRCLFIDDTEANVLAARAVGMQAVHYRGIEDLREAVTALTG